MAMKSEPARTALRQGAILAQLREQAARKATPAVRKDLEAFVAQAGDSFYGREAAALLRSLDR